MYVAKHLVKAYLLLPHIEYFTARISVNYTRPADFDGGPNEYRAASGPVTVTCTATGGRRSGTISYQWSSNCRSCPFQFSTSSSITRAAVHSGDNGTHTCVATRGADTEDAAEVADAGITFNVVGQSDHLNTSFVPIIIIFLHRP